MNSNFHYIHISPIKGFSQGIIGLAWDSMALYQYGLDKGWKDQGDYTGTIGRGAISEHL